MNGSCGNSDGAGGPFQGGYTPPLILLDFSSSTFSDTVGARTAFGPARLRGGRDPTATTPGGPAAVCDFQRSAFASTALSLVSRRSFSAGVDARRLASK